jgi:hypothetical protein
MLADRTGLARLAAGARSAYAARYHPDRVLAERLALYGALRECRA